MLCTGGRWLVLISTKIKLKPTGLNTLEQQNERYLSHLFSMLCRTRAANRNLNQILKLRLKRSKDSFKSMTRWAGQLPFKPATTVTIISTANSTGSPKATKLACVSVDSQG